MSRYTTTRDRHRARVEPRSRRSKVVGGLVGFSVAAALTGTAWAAIMATASPGGQTVGTGALSLTLTNDGTGFSQGISNMLPGDAVNRFVDLTSSGEAKDLTLALAADASVLATDATRGLAVTIDACSVAWNTTNGTCAGTTSSPSLLAQTAVANFGVSRTLITGPVSAGVRHLRIRTTLPDSTETTVNGARPTDTIQGQSTTLTYSFKVTQRNVTDTSS